MSWSAYRIGRPTLDKQQPDIVLAAAFPALRFHVMNSLSMENCWFVYVKTIDDKFIGNFWEPKESFPSDALVAKLALVA